jgi:excisionase family DNA binding protein
MLCVNATATKNDFVTVKTAALRLAVSEATIRRRVDDGTLLGYRLGSIRRVAASELDRLLDGQERV